MSYRTAGILSFIAVCGMFAFPIAAKAMLLPVFERAEVVPLYGRILLGLAFFVSQFKWFIIFPVVSLLLLLAALTNPDSRPQAKR
jgi:hypothetical protein